MAKAFSDKFYHSKKWKNIRAFVLQRDFYMCKICKMPNSSTVHHIKELTPMNINDSSISVNPDNLVTLCNRCHNLIHDKYKYNEDRKRYTFDAEGNVIPCPQQTNKLTDEKQRLINFYKSQLT